MQHEQVIYTSDKKKCFVIMPISDAPTYETGHFSRVYEFIIKPAVVKAGFIPIRADEVQESNVIIMDILKQIIYSDMCICDLSSKNPNVMYELGIRHAYSLPVTIIRDSKTQRVFDVQGLRDIEYDENLRIDNVNKIVECMATTIINTYNNKNDANYIVNLLGVRPLDSTISSDNLTCCMSAVENRESYNLDNCINKFLNDKKNEGLRETTLKTYRYQLSLFKKYINKNVNEISKEDIRLFLTKREEDYCISSNKTMMTVKSVLKTFFEWLINEKMISVNPVNNSKKYKTKTAYVETLSDNDMEKLRDSCKSLRERALIEVLYSTGCSLQEIINLKCKNIDWASSVIFIDSNFRGERIVFLKNDALNLLKGYLETRNDNCENVFVSKKKPYVKLSERGIQREIENISNRTDIKQSISPKVFRNTFANSLHNKGCPINIIKALLGTKDCTSPSETIMHITKNNMNSIYKKYFNDV